MGVAVRLNKENIPSRAYVAFKSEEQLALFGRMYDGHTFRDKNGMNIFLSERYLSDECEFTLGVETPAVVEFAPYPKIPSDKKKADSRNGTIEKGAISYVSPFFSCFSTRDFG
jgi:regulator of nonsense transcripts 3